MTFTTIGIALFLFSNAVQATATIRPLEDWGGDSVVDWADPDTQLVISPHTVEWCLYGPNWPFNFLDWEIKPMWECEYKGFILERVLDSEHTMITINFHVKEVPFKIFYMPDGYPYAPPIYSGIMKYYFQCRMIFSTESLYNILDISGEIPSLLQIFGAEFGLWPYPEEPVPLVDYVHLEGDGIITEGGEGIVQVNQIGLYDPKIGDYMWPIEIVHIL
ncbi:MAG: hypothetical protein ACXAAH_06655 [Promethearchaeota archaeon]|jgi:hypothetical protein